ncbi:hypothetical protein QEZ54_32165 [Catellatospora sp. KI3]|uniref:hypothetical protein n=1 Tax=Catellatospora sp. KI3 TaxID=3041620 RepID=UPI002482DFBF|nr:hypothetical protein [Catellatospora sp. KI3]MDI1465636.1 hypothetical protein [Catellatospora sp. KI3]
MRRALLLAAPIALAGVLLAGCNDTDGAKPAASAATSVAPAGNGVEALEATEILTKAKDALGKAGSYRIKGEMTENKMKLDIRVAGKDIVGTITMGGASIDLLSVGGATYFKADEAFWTSQMGEQGAALGKLVGTKWIKVPADNKEFGDFFKIADVNELLKPEGTIGKGKVETINGASAIALTEGAEKGSLYVATTGEPYPLRLAGPAGEGQIDFTDFGAKFDELKAPAEADVFDLGALMK